MKKIKWFIEGEAVTAWISDCQYFFTNKLGEGVFYGDLERGTWKQLVGTCQFSVYGLTDDSKKQKLRTWIKENTRIYDI